MNSPVFGVDFGAALVANSASLLVCSTLGGTSCTSLDTSAPIAAGSQLSILVTAAVDSDLPAGQPLYVSFTCQ
jgi:hypothetical protein